MSSSFIDFRRISKKCISWRMLTEFQQGRQSRVGKSFAVELQDKCQCMETLCLGKDLKIGEYLVRSRSIKSEPSLVVKSYTGRSNQLS